ncbi:hypothetical protein [Clostridium beijerinckii]|uniref:hypothetical protein n=1 Tax=Clostridium beijerinckii TaxID=1520 RepID=UPI001F253062|nr:hypothetical protein [Clostridium beijerinckii]
MCKKIEDTNTILKEIFENYRKYDKRKITPEYIDKDPIIIGAGIGGVSTALRILKRVKLLV